eukprot:800847-Prorocentrum_minimum.AAC.7
MTSLHSDASPPSSIGAAADMILGADNALRHENTKISTRSSEFTSLGSVHQPHQSTRWMCVVLCERTGPYLRVILPGRRDRTGVHIRGPILTAGHM